MRTVEEVDREIAATEKTAAKLEGDRGKNQELLATAKASREKHSLSALSTSDPQSLAHLTKARAAQREMEMLLEDIASAIGEVRRQLERLRAEREQSYRHEKWQEFLKAANAAAGQASLIDAAFTTLTKLFVEHEATLKQMTQLCAAAGRSKEFSFAHLRRSKEAWMWAIAPGVASGVHAPSDAYKTKRYAEILAQLIDSAGNVGEAPTQTEQAQVS